MFAENIFILFRTMSVYCYESMIHVFMDITCIQATQRVGQASGKILAEYRVSPNFPYSTESQKCQKKE